MDIIINSEFFDEVTDIEILGGGLRVPKIKEMI